MKDRSDLVLVAGDTHGNALHVYYLFERALNLDADKVLVVGDFGYWEHRPEGVAFLDVCSDLAVSNDITLYFIDGNHENHTMLREVYGPDGLAHKPSPEGFWRIREGVYYIPRGCRWEWNGHRLMGLGGAYSVDKYYRLKKEAQDRRKLRQEYEGRIRAGLRATKPNYGAVLRWWEEEELTDADVATALATDEPLDILFTHDKPRASNPPVNFKENLDVYPNQDRVQKVVNRLTPKLVIHGHLHVRYEDKIRCGDNGMMTHVLGLDCDVDQDDPQQLATRDPADSWVLLDLSPKA